jgi:membrane protease YdiL (CAAX protease family)
MRKFVEGLTDRGEFVLVTFIAFGHAIVSSTAFLLLRRQQYAMSSTRIARGIVVELAILLIVAWCLSLRGWTAERLGLTFGWGQALAGFVLFIAQMFLYWTVASLVVSSVPSAAHMQVPHLVRTAPASLILLFILINSLYEEVLVAAYVIESLSAQGAAVAISASTLLRFSYHLYQGPIASISILPMGLLFGIIYWRGRNVWPLLVAHTIMNLIALSR